MTKQEIIKLLEEKKYAELSENAKKDIKGIFRRLIGLAYDKEDIVCWRAIEAIGMISGEISKVNPEVVRSLAQRLLWMMRDESGNNPWSAPEMLGEIVRNSPDAYSDIAPVIMSFHDEHILRRGVLRAAVRISEVRPELLEYSHDFMETCFGDEDDVVRFYAIMLAGLLNLKQYLPAVRMQINEKAAVKIYDEGDFMYITIGEAAKRVCVDLDKKEN